MRDLAVFSGVVGEADAAFQTDASYVVAMVRSASVIQAKRKTWSARLELRRAEQSARAQCRAAPLQTICANTSPCGTDQCRFATGDLAHLNLGSCPGATARPHQMALGGSYSIEEAVGPLKELRAAENL